MRPSNTKERGKSTRGRFKSRGRSNSPGDTLKKICRKFGKLGHFKKSYRSKSVERGKGSEDTPSIDKNPSTKEGGDVSLASTST